MLSLSRAIRLPRARKLREHSPAKANSVESWPLRIFEHLLLAYTRWERSTFSRWCFSRGFLLCRIRMRIYRFPMLTLAYVPIISRQEKSPDRSGILRLYARRFLSPRDVGNLAVVNSRLDGKKKESSPSKEIVSVATNRRSPITNELGRERKSARGGKEKADDDEANASDVVSRDRRPSSGTTKAQHREATHKYIHIYIRPGALC